VARVVLYTTPFCPYCVMAKRLFKTKGAEFEEVDVSGDREKRAWLLEQTGQHTVPQIFIEGKSYGGFTDVSALDRRGALEPLLALD
jgi:glutaredoxin 3